MERITISLDEQLAQDFDAWLAGRGYLNRSEAVRDLVREKLGAQLLGAGQAKWCIATLTYVYDRSEPSVAAKVVKWQHDHHDLVISSHSTPLDHQDCLETVVMRGDTSSLQICATQLIATRGVRHGNIHVLPLRSTRVHTHHGAAGHHHSHHHLEPIS